MKLSTSLAEEIEEKMRKIQDNPKYFSERVKLIEEGLRNLADVHSYWLEYPDHRARLLRETGAKNQKDLKKLAKKGINQVKSGWAYLISDRFKEGRNGFLNYMNPDAIKVVGKMIEPLKNERGFRTGLEYVGLGLSYTPPSPLLIEDLLKKLCNEIKRSSAHPVEMAAEAHLRLAGIQPFNDGNKRTARLFEKRILEGYGYPPAFIAYGERQTYVGLLEKALASLRNYYPNAEHTFCDYIGGKVNIALDTILDDLEIH